MKDYYQTHKTITTCEACSLNFVGARALQHHTDHNVRCLLARANGIVDQLKDKHPGPTTLSKRRSAQSSSGCRTS